LILKAESSIARNAQTQAPVPRPLRVGVGVSSDRAAWEATWSYADSALTVVLGEGEDEAVVDWV
jgi:hypothetical protein